MPKLTAARHNVFDYRQKEIFYMDAKKIKNIALTAIPIAICVIFIIVPIFEAIGLMIGLDFSLYSETLIAILQTVVAIGATVAVFILKPKYSTLPRLCLLFAAPISLLNALSFANGDWGGSIICAVIWCGCILALYLKFVPDSVLKAMSAIVSVLVAIVFCVVFVWGLISGALSERKVEDSYESHNGTYVAEVCVEESLISSKTVIIVKRATPEFGAFFGSYSAPEMTVYEGEAHEAETALINWLDDETVIINGEAYRINVE